VAFGDQGIADGYSWPETGYDGNDDEKVSSHSIIVTHIDKNVAP
jgi:hypothetical protein